MKKPPILRLVLAACLAFATPAFAKKSKPAPSGGEQTQGGADSGGIPRYKPFPHDQTFILKDINGKAPPVEMWLRIDTTGRATGFSGCKNWSGVFVVGPERLGPRAMPAVNDHKCDGAPQTAERDYWAVLLSGPYWDTQGDDLILKGFKGGALRFARSL